jgi:hypothetical protein
MVEWKKTDPPRDRKILRFHKYWDCVISVYYKEKTSSSPNCIWISSTYTAAWPEAAFLPVWAEEPNKPEGFNNG